MCVEEYLFFLFFRRSFDAVVQYLSKVASGYVASSCHQHLLSSFPFGLRVQCKADALILLLFLVALLLTAVIAGLFILLSPILFDFLTFSILFFFQSVKVRAFGILSISTQLQRRRARGFQTLEYFPSTLDDQSKSSADDDDDSLIKRMRERDVASFHYPLIFTAGSRGHPRRQQLLIILDTYYIHWRCPYMFELIKSVNEQRKIKRESRLFKNSTSSSSEYINNYAHTESTRTVKDVNSRSVQLYTRAHTF